MADTCPVCDGTPDPTGHDPQLCARCDRIVMADAYEEAQADRVAWITRAERAEAERDALRAQLATATAALREIAERCDMRGSLHDDGTQCRLSQEWPRECPACYARQALAQFASKEATDADG